jgi:hypothetical protein
MLSLLNYKNDIVACSALNYKLNAALITAKLAAHADLIAAIC